EAVRLASDGKDLRAQLAKDVRRNVVGGAVGRIHHDGKTREGQFVREGALAEFDVAASRIVDAPGPTQLFRLYTFDLFVEHGLDLGFHVVGQFHAIAGEEFDAVVVIRIM